MKRITAILTALLATTIILTACDKNVVYNTYMHADSKGWEKNEALEFTVDSLTESGNYAMTLALRVNDSYPFQNLHIVVDQTIYPSRQTVNDTITCYVTNRRGIMRGYGVSLYQYELPLRKRFYMHGDSIQIRVRHNMKREILPGIADVGIVMKKDNG